ncbi:hypothetical protein PPL_06367 [Heterostelium album PN500]|uniref:Methyltransferase FkbM domain-containing protein n=1 Tax=Heterostelium pallidum (strain ATCC 26659 / Pp 5 / PN500) TaxID=670386 RepID=D3BCY9_HETP5|nr:hypothetical protein PPL_06367 [Heterostelium album PN500]EFA80781.1 hypothetical protein PPL_06367 [Heterostelium album PN500]|eukprot:XP_020432900.1 hypothetical protein PPL_06367 [Heterostelium album PN500]
MFSNLHIYKIRSEQVSLKHKVSVLTKHIKDIKDTNKSQININSNTTLSNAFVQVMKDKLYNQEYRKNVKGEGSWKICQDSDKWHVNRSNQCQVFSFGIAYDFTFDDELIKLDSKVGIADKDTNDFEGKEYKGSKKQVWEVYTLETLMKRFKVEYLDFLKMDIEGNEWPILKQWIESESYQSTPCDQIKKSSMLSEVCLLVSTFMNRNNLLILIFSVILVTIISSSIYITSANSKTDVTYGIEKITKDQETLKNTLNVLITHIKEIKDNNEEQMKKIERIDQNIFIPQLKNQLVDNNNISEAFVQVMKNKLYKDYTEEQSAEVGSLLLNSVLFEDGKCNSYKVLGGGTVNAVPGEGSWKICQDSDKWHVNRSNQCQVFSFGIANDFTFDDELTKLGCKVESFDPSMSMESQKRSDLNNFWKIGIADKDTQTFEGKEYGGSSKQVWEVYTLETLMKRFKVEYLDFLKIGLSKEMSGQFSNNGSIVVFSRKSRCSPSRSISGVPIMFKLIWSGPK